MKMYAAVSMPFFFSHVMVVSRIHSEQGNEIRKDSLLPATSGDYLLEGTGMIQNMYKALCEVLCFTRFLRT